MEEEQFVWKIVTTAAFAVSWIVVCSYLSYRTQRFHYRIVSFYFNFILVVLCSYVFLSKHVPADHNLILFLLQYILNGGKTKYCLLLFWMICVVASLIFITVVYKSRHHIRISSEHRKFFHLTISLVSVSGLQIDPQLLFLASSLIVCAMITLECVRVLKIPPFGSEIDQVLKPFLDEHDSGILILTPLYLLIGAFFPIWLHPVSVPLDIRLKHFSGVITVGLGDSFAAIVGRQIGKIHWPRSKKTLEGSLGCVLGQIVGFLICLRLIRKLMFLSSYDMFYLLFVSVIIALTEVFFGAFDNLVLPIIGYSLLINF